MILAEENTTLHVLPTATTKSDKPSGKLPQDLSLLIYSLHYRLQLAVVAVEY